MSQADLKRCLWPHGQPAAKPTEVSAARAEAGHQARVSLESALPPFHHQMIVQINQLILKVAAEVLR